MKKRTRLISSILSGLCLVILGCGGEESKTEEAKPEVHVAKPGPGVEPGPVQPSMTPSMPPTTSPMPEPKKDEPKAETPK